MTSRTDTERLVQFLRDHPGSSVMEVRMSLWISNVTGRMSDAQPVGRARQFRAVQAVQVGRHRREVRDEAHDDNRQTDDRGRKHPRS